MFKMLFIEDRKHFVLDCSKYDQYISLTPHIYTSHVHVLTNMIPGTFVYGSVVTQHPVKKQGARREFLRF